MENLTQDNWTEKLANTADAVILDVRTPAECSSGIIPNAVQLNIMDGSSFMSGIAGLDKTKSYFIYCRSGNRSGQACDIMESQGFDKTYNLIGGMTLWNGDIA